MPITWIGGGEKEDDDVAVAAAIFNGTLINGGRERESEGGGEIEFQTLQSLSIPPPPQ